MNTLASFFASIIALFSGLLGQTIPPPETPQQVTEISYVTSTSSSKALPTHTPIINKKGIVYFQYTNTNNWKEEDNGLEIALKFMEASSSQSEELIHMSGAKGSIYPASNFVYHDQVIYFIDKEGMLNKVTGSDISNASKINLSLKQEEFVSDFFIQGDIIYYLSGPFCNTYMGICDNTLKTFNTISGTSTELATNLKENSISGFSLNGNKIILSKGSGDAGCAWQSFLTFDLLQKLIVSTDNFNWCFDEKGTEEELKKKEMFETTIYPKATTTQYLQFTNGKLMPKKNTSILDLITPKDGRSSLELMRVY
jgi:hypothetical protein